MFHGSRPTHLKTLGKVDEHERILFKTREEVDARSDYVVCAATTVELVVDGERVETLGTTLDRRENTHLRADELDTLATCVDSVSETVQGALVCPKGGAPSSLMCSTDAPLPRMPPATLSAWIKTSIAKHTGAVRDKGSLYMDTATRALGKANLGDENALFEFETTVLAPAQSVIAHARRSKNYVHSVTGRVVGLDVARLASWTDALGRLVAWRWRGAGPRHSREVPW